MANDAKKDAQVFLETVLWDCRVALRGIGSTEKNRADKQVDLWK